MSERSPLSRASWRVEAGDCLEVLERLPAESIDAVVTDPPYGLAFMGEHWDTHASPREFQAWTEQWARACLRVLKPGGHLLAFGGTRTAHRIACAVEDAGLEIRDRMLTLNGHVLGPELDWLYGAGWPKSRNISKAIDKRAGAQREIIGSKAGLPGYSLAPSQGGSVYGEGIGGTGDPERESEITAPATPEAAEWEGWGTALKPAHEPIVVARKPFRGTVEEQVLRSSTGALNIDACRIDAGGETITAGMSDPENRKGVVGAAHTYTRMTKDDMNARQAAALERANSLGRWPANVVLLHAPECERVGERVVRGDQRAGTDAVGAGRSWLREAGPHPAGPVHGDEIVESWACAEHCPVRLLDEQSGELRSGDPTAVGDAAGRARQNAYVGESRAPGTPIVGYGDAGGASRFFYSGKASPAERDAGLDGFAPTGRIDVGGGRRRCGACGAWEWRPQQPDLRRCSCDAPEWVNVTTKAAHRNIHPTVKPIDLMRWLCRLVTPPGGVVLDPFAGSGSTGCAAVLEGFEFIGVEKDARFHPIAQARIRFWAGFPPGTAVDDVLEEVGRDRRVAVEAEQRRAELAAAGQDALFTLHD